MNTSIYSQKLGTLIASSIKNKKELVSSRNLLNMPETSVEASDQTGTFHCKLGQKDNQVLDMHVRHCFVKQSEAYTTATELTIFQLCSTQERSAQLANRNVLVFFYDALGTDTGRSVLPFKDLYQYDFLIMYQSCNISMIFLLCIIVVFRFVP